MHAPSEIPDAVHLFSEQAHRNGADKDKRQSGRQVPDFHCKHSGLRIVVEDDSRASG